MQKYSAWLHFYPKWDEW